MPRRAVDREFVIYNRRRRRAAAAGGGGRRAGAAAVAGGGAHFEGGADGELGVGREHRDPALCFAVPARGEREREGGV